mmetsp:Transcript_29072/g.52978  ORF Transcript_29072/g.52978 Transcript_29072/m.52978 type:complete len:275 (-) Transcript_29072:37-861(-)
MATVTTTEESYGADLSWNVFRYLGDGVHVTGIFVLLATLASRRSCAGFSRSTQLLYFLVFITRYLDLLQTSVFYLILFKVTYIVTALLILFFFAQLAHTYERQKDTCSLMVILVPCAAAAILLRSDDSLVEVLWSFSQFLEGFALVPQYIFCYRDVGGSATGVSLYIVCLGSYRTFYIAGWIYRKLNSPEYLDLQSWTGGALETAFFLDYLLARFGGVSLLRAAVLKLDEKINAAKAQVEMRVLGHDGSFEPTLDASGTVLRQRARPESIPDGI